MADGGNDGAIARVMADAAVSPDEARFYLEAAGGDVDAAIALVRENRPPPPPPPARPAAPATGPGAGAGDPSGYDEPRTRHDAFAAVRAAEEELVRRTHRQRQQQQQQAGGGGGPHQAPQPPRGGLLGFAMRLPFAVLRTGVGVVASAVGVGLAVAAFFGDRVLPRALMLAARRLAEHARLAADDSDPAAQAAEFAAAFAERHLSEDRSGGAAGGAAAAGAGTVAAAAGQEAGARTTPATAAAAAATAAAAPAAPPAARRSPAWVAAGWRPAAAAAHRDFRLLFAYLHAPRHQDADAFCRGVLCAPDFADFANNEFVCWGGDVTRSDAFSLSLRLGVTRYPAVALLSRSGAGVKLAALVQGAPAGDPGALAAALRSAAEPHAALLAAERADAEGRAAERALVREQDDEYERSLAADRAREQQRREQCAREQAAKAAAEQAERAELEQREAREARRLAEASAAAAAREAKRAALPQEPAPGAPDAAAVRVRLPTGANHQRRFDARRDTIASLYAWVDALEHAAADAAVEQGAAGAAAAGEQEDEAALTARLLALERYVLVQAFPPRRELARAAGAGGGQTLEEAGLAPQAALFVRLVDEEEEGGEGGAA